MGDQGVIHDQGDEARRRFTRQLLQDVRALSYMIDHKMFETGARRIGAEQELFLVDSRMHPAPVAEALLESCKEARIVPELTRFNVEFNMDPLTFGGDCLRRLEVQAHELLAQVRVEARKQGADVVMTGILPTIHLSDLRLDNMMPRPRYYALNDAVQKLRGGAGQIQIRGTDELMVRHEGMMMEGCNTSFQTHFQVDPSNFAAYYNLAQVVAGPVMAISCNSPLLFGKSLWHETRIALFQQAVDMRSSNLYLREMSPRVHFGSRWVQHCVTEIFKEDIARFPVLLTPDEWDEDPFEVLSRGEIPRLRALLLHNGTVYRWNRAVYGVTDAGPHLRIENRILPAGPSIVDEIANAALWFGLVSGLTVRGIDPREHLRFEDARSNFIAAARQGLGSSMVWMDGIRAAAPELLEKHLLPLAHEGLAAAGIDNADRERYLGIVAQRVHKQMTGARWFLDGLSALKQQAPDKSRTERMEALVAATIERQESGLPVHEWSLPQFKSQRTPQSLAGTCVEHFMTTELFTVQQDELIDLVACLMDWQHIRHVLVEDEQHHLVGIISSRNLLRYFADFGVKHGAQLVSVRDIMVPDPICVEPETSTVEAIRIMRKHRIGALPVLRQGQLVGIITERDFLDIAGQVLDSLLHPSS